MALSEFDKLRGLIGSWDINPERGEELFDVCLGPCAIEGHSMLEACAEAASDLGASYLRGGAIKLRTRHNTFQGYGVETWPILRIVADKFGLKTVSEITRESDVDYASRYLNIIQIGARSMWNFGLLESSANAGLPVMLKRGLGATTSDWLGVADRLLSMGCNEVILCERGLASIDRASRNAVDLSTLVFLAEQCPLKIWLDVSHTSGDPWLARRLICIAQYLGIDGVMGEIHPDPKSALCDSEQAIAIKDLNKVLI